MNYLVLLTGTVAIWAVILGIIIGHRTWKAGLKMGFRLCEALYKDSTESLADVKPGKYVEPAEFGLLDKKEEEEDEQKEKV